MQPLTPLRVLHVDDDPFELERVEAALAGGGFVVTGVSDPAAATAALQSGQPDVVLLDLHLAADAGGLDLVSPARRLAPGCVVIVLSAADDGAAVGSALGADVDDYVSKDTDAPLLRRLVGETHARAQRLAAAVAPAGPADAVGATLRSLAVRIPALLTSAVTGVHIHGETGTGKEVVARLFKTAAGGRPFLSVNCGAIPPSLLESTLFGVVKGSFTGAAADRQGYLAAASGGWLFLDEIGCLTLPAQAALLRAIENQEIIRVGDHRPQPIDVRFVSATNEDLRALVAAGRFRADLWQRLSEVELQLPPLRDRRGEIRELIDHFAATLPGGPYTVTSAAANLLAEQPWREGNVRQLRNCLRAMTERQVDGILTPQAIPARYLRPEVMDESGESGESDDGALKVAPGDGPRPFAFEALSVQLFATLVRRLVQTHGRQSVRQLADHLALSKSTLQRRLKEAEALGYLAAGEP